MGGNMIRTIGSMMPKMEYILPQKENNNNNNKDNKNTKNNLYLNSLWSSPSTMLLPMLLMVMPRRLTNMFTTLAT